MASFNKVILMGNLTHNPEIRSVGRDGMKVARLRLAINERRRDRNGQMADAPVFVDVDAWDRLAELSAQYLSKGRSILVEGRLQMDTWEKDGVRHQKLKVRAIALKFLPQGDGRQRSDAAAAAQIPQDAEARDRDADENGEIPF